MSLVHTLDLVTAWVQENICDKVTLKVPPEDYEDIDASGYEYKTMHPTAFAMYLPSKEKLPPSIVSPIPSILVRYTEGQDSLSSNRGEINIELCLSTWSNGTHGKDILLPNKEDNTKPKRWTGAEAEAYFKRNGDGWRDAHNMIDTTLREIESVTNISGIEIDRTVPIKFGPLKEQEAIPDFYPLWFAVVSFTLTYPLQRAIKGLDKYL